MYRFIFLLVCVLSFAGCSSAPPKQSFNAEANAAIKHITVANPPTVDEVRVVMLTHPGQSFGLLGGLAAVADMASKTKRYNEVVGNEVAWDKYVTQQIQVELQRVGYKASKVMLRKAGKGEAAFLDKYPAIPSADAVLDFYYDVGQIASGATTNYVPTVKLRVRLTDLQQQTVLYEQQFTAGLATNREDITFPPVGREYSNIGALVANSTESVESLKAGIQQIAKRIAADLAR